jgi:hypothetical protein
MVIEILRGAIHPVMTYCKNVIKMYFHTEVVLLHL